jgi:L-rhamnose isomerase
MLRDRGAASFAEAFPAHQTLDSIECKLFGIGSESYVVRSHEFYLGFAITRQKLLCLDAGHFHPTEVILDKISSALMFAEGLLAAYLVIPCWLSCGMI